MLSTPSPSASASASSTSLPAGVDVTLQDAPAAAADADLAACQSLCNLTQPLWCENFLLGLRTLHCSNIACVNSLCQVATNCQEDSLSEEASKDYCPTIFDGWTCVNRTGAGEMATFKCPDFDHFNFHNQNMALRECSPEGVWYDSVMEKPFTRYEDCPDANSFQWYDTVNKIYVAGYSISLLFLLVATLIFLYFRSLRCVRNTIHTNLFVASIFHNVVWILWYYEVVYRMGGILQWEEWQICACKILNTLVHYLTVCTYFWMLCEGVYLFVVLTVTFVSESRVLLCLCSLGWGLPAVLILIYALFRGVSSEHTHHRFCWMEDTPLNWIFKGPCIATIVVNLLFLVRIVYVLLSKLHTDVSDRAALVKTTRAIGVLVPLLGLHNILMAFKPDGNDSTTRIVIELVSAVTISFQGMVVAVLFCLINNEVCVQLKKFFGDRLNLSRANNHGQSMAMTQYTVAKTSQFRSASPNMMAIRQEFLAANSQSDDEDGDGGSEETMLRKSHRMTREAAVVAFRQGPIATTCAATCEGANTLKLPVPV